MATPNRKATVTPIFGLKHCNRTIKDVLKLGTFTKTKPFYGLGLCSEERMLRELENYDYSEFVVERSSWFDIFESPRKRLYRARISVEALKRVMEMDKNTGDGIIVC